MSFASPVALLLAEIAVVLAATSAMGSLFVRLRQPRTIGEIVAGLMLGPSLLGWVWPGAFQTIFTNPAGLNTLNMLAQIGVILFLFLVGLEFDAQLVRKRGRAAAAISISGICVPFVLGFGVTYPLAHLFGAERQQSIFSVAMFMGAAMSVTAFPVLARIVTEWNLQRTEEGGLAIAAAAVDDVLAWTLLAVVTAFAPSAAGGGAHASSAGVVLGWTALFIATMWFLVRPLLARLYRFASPDGTIGSGMLALTLLVMLASALATETIGVHALFGAFIAGLCMPKRGAFAHEITSRLESTAVIFMLPLFFAYAGLKVDLRQLLHWNMIGYTALLTAIASLGKLGGTSVAAMATGLSPRKSLLVGVLMNTRGLMELIILTVGLQLGVLNETVYGMMVIMALVTTGAAAPLINLLRRSQKTLNAAEAALA